MSTSTGGGQNVVSRGLDTIYMYASNGHGCEDKQTGLHTTV